MQSERVPSRERGEEGELPLRWRRAVRGGAGFSRWRRAVRGGAGFSRGELSLPGREAQTGSRGPFRGDGRGHCLPSEPSLRVRQQFWFFGPTWAF